MKRSRHTMSLLQRGAVLVLWAFVLTAQSLAPAQTRPAPAPSEPRPPVLIDQVWAGTGVRYDAVSAGPVVYIGYYDAERYLTVARYDSERGELRKKRLDDRFTGWDAHNYVTLALDAAGRLHVAANMHVTPLVYARMTEPDDLDSLTLLNRMTGSDERHTTYPQFFRFPGGDLGFTYRSGRSGDGVELINRFDGERWRREVSTPLLAPAPGGERVNAYHTGYVLGPDGQFHMAWVWRKTPDAQTNFHVNYARSPDLRAWFDSRGRRLALPMTPAHAEVAVPATVKQPWLRERGDNYLDAHRYR